jgi:hypothetical protein
MKYFISLCILLISVSCTETPSQDPVMTEIKALDTNEKIQAYWEQLYELDQKYRKEESLIQQQYGYESPEHKEIIATIMRVDQENLEKVRKAIPVLGYPDPAILGKDASYTPWAVVHHAQGLGVREEFFPVMYQAWKEQKLDGGAMALYLFRMYQMKSGETFKMEGAFREEDQIDTLITLLELEKPRS